MELLVSNLAVGANKSVERETGVEKSHEGKRYSVVERDRCGEVT